MTQIIPVRDATGRVIAKVFTHPTGLIDIEGNGMVPDDVCRLTAALIDLPQTEGFDFKLGTPADA